VSDLDRSALRGRLTEVRERIARAEARAGRPAGAVRLVAVSKTFDAEYVRAAAEGGQIDFGENKVQEALQKQARTSDLQIRWHLVGHLQSNKARKASGGFDVIHSVDGADLLRKIDDAAAEANREIELLVQVDLFHEATKHGAGESSLAPIFDAAAQARSTRVVGLMLIPPAVEDPEGARPFFRALRELRDRLAAAGTDASMLRELSMGMSHDFEVAIEEGATMVRVGTAIFGERHYER
jgi:pyridoxal phosphate enzyme (YggS family)